MYRGHPGHWQEMNSCNFQQPGKMEFINWNELEVYRIIEMMHDGIENILSSKREKEISIIAQSVVTFRDCTKEKSIDEQRGN